MAGAARQSVRGSPIAVSETTRKEICAKDWTTAPVRVEWGRGCDAQGSLEVLPAAGARTAAPLLRDRFASHGHVGSRTGYRRVPREKQRLGANSPARDATEPSTEERIAMGGPRGTPEERFARYVEVTDTCWLWTGALTHGYGQLTISVTERVLAHRFAYEHFIGPIPKGLTIDHLCRVPRCVNPAHLEAVPLGVNVMRSPLSSSGANIRKTHCPKGHSYDKVSKRGWRVCSTCERTHDIARNERRRLARRGRVTA